MARGLRVHWASVHVSAPAVPWMNSLTYSSPTLICTVAYYSHKLVNMLFYESTSSSEFSLLEVSYLEIEAHLE